MACKNIDDYKKLSLDNQTKKKGGKQKKGHQSGIYSWNGQEYYIKQSLLFPADNIAEVAAGRLLRLVIGEQAVEYEAVIGDNFDVYIASKKSMKPLDEQVKLPRYFPGSDPYWDKNKEFINEILNADQRKLGMVKILAGCLWVNDNDCHIGNILFDSVRDVVKKFDHGWALVDICKPEHAKVSLFEKISPHSSEKKGTHPPSHLHENLVPINHFNDYPKIIRSKEFIGALKEISDKANDNNITSTVEAIVTEIKKDYENSSLNQMDPPDPQRALKLFAEHIGLNVSEKPENLEEFIKKNLTKRLKERRDSMKLLKCMLEIDLALEKKTPGPDPDTVIKLLETLKKTILEQYQDNGNCRIDKILPPYETSSSKSFATLMEESIKLIESSPGDKKVLISFFSEFSKTKNQKLANELPDFTGEGLCDFPSKNFFEMPKSSAPAQSLAAAIRFIKRKIENRVAAKASDASKCLSSYCDFLNKGFNELTTLAVEEISPEKIMSVLKKTKKIVIKQLKDGINTVLPDGIGNLKEVFPTVLNANIQAGLTELSLSGSFEALKYMTQTILQEQTKSPNITIKFTDAAKKVLNDKGHQNIEEFMYEMSRSLSSPSSRRLST